MIVEGFTEVSKVGCDQTLVCPELQCGGKEPHEYDVNECGRCPKNKEARCVPLEDATKRIKRFHAHLDVCTQCENHPFDLCPTGAKLLKYAATGGVQCLREFLR